MIFRVLCLYLPLWKCPCHLNLDHAGHVRGEKKIAVTIPACCVCICVCVRQLGQSGSF